MTNKSKFLNYLEQINIEAYQYYGDNINLDDYTFQMILNKYINMLSTISSPNNKDNERASSYYTHHHPNADKPKNKYYIPKRKNKHPTNDGPEL